MTLTNVGKEAVVRRLNGENIEIVGVVIGNGERQIADTVTILNSQRMALEIVDQTVVGSTLKITASFTNNSVQTGFRCTEEAILCEIDGELKIYAYQYNPIESADYICSSEEAVLETQYEYIVDIGNGSGEVNVNINGSIVTATKAELEMHTNNMENPHGVTKGQVGLGDVPNVTTDNQTPIWTEPQTLTVPNSGEKLGGIMGKLALSVRWLLGHMADNTHHVSSADRASWNAKPEPGHTHKTTDINSGTFGVGHGGTGLSSFSANRLFFADTASSMAQIPLPTEDGMVLMQNRQGAPHWQQGTFFGTYTGGGQPSGTAGPYQTTLRITGAPRLVVIMDTDSSSVGFFMVSVGLASYGISVVNGTHYQLVCNATDSGPDTILSWRSQDWENPRPDWQLDTDGHTYAYTVIF